MKVCLWAAHEWQTIPLSIMVWVASLWAKAGPYKSESIVGRWNYICMLPFHKANVLFFHLENWSLSALIYCLIIGIAYWNGVQCRVPHLAPLVLYDLCCILGNFLSPLKETVPSIQWLIHIGVRSTKTLFLLFLFVFLALPFKIYVVFLFCFVLTARQ